MAPKKKESSKLRLIPKVDVILNDPELIGITSDVPRWIYMDAVRDELDSVRRRLIEDPDGTAGEELLERSGMIRRIGHRISLARLYGLRRVVNGTGIIIHTNLGRAVLARVAANRIAEVAGHYSNLEFDLDEGRRGLRHARLKELIRRLTGAEDALVVNNNAAAVLLTLNTLARGREVIVSRGELVEIGGSFRIPDVMARSGAIMKEVGTTNRTHLKDYEKAIRPETAILLKVHTSNYQVVGFTHQPTLEELAGLGKSRNITVVEDLGSGCLVDLSPFGLSGEPPVGRSIEAGADLVTFSGDKLLGGPQAGIIIGRADLVRSIESNPLHRALRIDKFTAAAMEATLRLYLEGERAYSKIPVLSMITKDNRKLKSLGRRLLKKWAKSIPGHVKVALAETFSQVGGGSLPMQNLPSVSLSMVSERMSVNDLESYFRMFEPPIIGRILEDRFLLDLRTIQEDDLDVILSALENLRP